MHNVGTAFAVKRAVINDEPLIERVVTLTGDKISEKGNYWVRLGTPVDHLLAQVGYQYDERFPCFRRWTNDGDYNFLILTHPSQN